MLIFETEVYHTAVVTTYYFDVGPASMTARHQINIEDMLFTFSRYNELDKKVYFVRNTSCLAQFNVELLKLRTKIHHRTSANL